MDIQIPQVLFQAINFGVVAGALTYLLYKPIQKILDERSDRIAAAQKAAEETLKEKDQLNQYQEKVAREARAKANEILQKAKDDAQRQGQQIVKKAQAQAESVLEKSRSNWEREKEKLAQEMKAGFAETVLLVTERVVGKLDQKTHTKLVDQEIKNILAKLN